MDATNPTDWRIVADCAVQILTAARGLIGVDG